MKKQTPTQVAIVTVSTNKLDEACLTSVRKVLDATKLKVKFVVVDNGSTTMDVHALVRTHVPEAVVILRDKNHGFGSSCNLGANEVEAEYYFFLNPDTRIDNPLAVDELYAFMKRYPKVGIVAPRIRYMDGRIQETCRRFPAWYTPIIQRTSIWNKKRAQAHKSEFLMEEFSHAERRLVDWVQGSAFLMDGALFHAIGGFDPRYFMYYEDVDLCRQSWERGRPVYYFPEVEVFHAYGKESAQGNGIVHQLWTNQKTRAHIASWIKYSLKWWGHRI